MLYCLNLVAIYGFRLQSDKAFLAQARPKQALHDTSIIVIIILQLSHSWTCQNEPTMWCTIPEQLSTLLDAISLVMEAQGVLNLREQEVCRTCKKVTRIIWHR